MQGNIPFIMEEDSDDDMPFDDDDIEIIDDAELEDYDSDEFGAEEQQSIALEVGAESTDDAKVVFSKHTGSVFCCAFDKNTPAAVSGGEDDMAYVWNTSTGEVIFECPGHKDSVTCVCFNHDGSLLATGDMSGLIQVWKMDTHDKLWTVETFSDLRWLEWHHASNILIAGTISGDSWMWKVPSGECKTFQGTTIAQACGSILPDGKRMVTGYEDGSVRIWELKTCSVIHAVTNASAHEESLTSVDCHPDNMLVATGSLDSTAKLINSNSGKVVATFQCGESDGKNGESETKAVESVAFSTSQPYLATASLSGSVFIWDIPSQVNRQTCKHNEEGVIKIVWHKSSPLLFSAGVDGVVKLWDSRSGNMEVSWHGHSQEILDMDISKDGSKVLASGNDQTCRVFHLNKT